MYCTCTVQYSNHCKIKTKTHSVCEFFHILFFQFSCVVRRYGIVYVRCFYTVKREMALNGSSKTAAAAAFDDDDTIGINTFVFTVQHGVIRLINIGT